MIAAKPTAQRKGQQTRAAIVAAALEHAARNGLEGITIGALAERMQMSKSGVFAHFGSREELQIAVLKAYEVRFIDTILKPALAEVRGLPRLVAILERWLAQTVIEATMGCIWVSGASEYDDRPGAVRDELVAKIQGWQREIGRAIGQAIQVGHLRPDTDIDDIVFGIYGVVLVLHHDARLMRSADALPRAQRALGRFLRQYTVAGVAPADAALARLARADRRAAAMPEGSDTADASSVQPAESAVQPAESLQQPAESLQQPAESLQRHQPV